MDSAVAIVFSLVMAESHLDQELYRLHPEETVETTVAVSHRRPLQLEHARRTGRYKLYPTNSARSWDHRSPHCPSPEWGPRSPRDADCRTRSHFLVSLARSLRLPHEATMEQPRFYAA